MSRRLLIEPIERDLKSYVGEATRPKSQPGEPIWFWWITHEAGWQLQTEITKGK